VIDLQNLPNETLAINVSADGYQNRSLVVEAPAKSYDTALVPTSDPTLPPGANGVPANERAVEAC